MRVSEHAEREMVDERAAIWEYLLQSNGQREGRLDLMTELVLADEVSYAHLVDVSGLSMTTVRRHVLRLEDNDVVEVSREPGHVASIAMSSMDMRDWSSEILRYFFSEE